MFSLGPRATALLLLLVALSGCGGGGKDADNQAPSVKFTAAAGSDPTSYTFDAAATVDPEGDSMEYWWNFGDGSAPVQGQKVAYDYQVTNTKFLVSLVVRDGRGAADAALQQVKLGSGANAEPEAELAKTNRWVKPGSTLVLDASTSHDGDGDALAFDWIFGSRVPAADSAKGLANACAQSSAEPFIFSTGCLGITESYNLTFDQAGTYDYHCHPHPWMKARIVVTPEASMSGAHTIFIENFAYSEKVVQVQPGTTVTFTNRDPAAHTATIEYFGAGKPQSSTPQLTVSPAPGDYIARLFLDDLKGGRATVTYGVRVGDDAPPDPNRTTVPKPLGPPTTHLQGVENWYNVTHETRIEATLDWGTTVSTAQGDLSLVFIDDKGSPQNVPECVAAAGGAGKLKISCTLEPGNYKFRVKAKEGSALPEWTLTVDGRPYANPGFGDSAGGGHHH